MLFFQMSFPAAVKSTRVCLADSVMIFLFLLYDTFIYHAKFLF